MFRSVRATAVLLTCCLAVTPCLAGELQEAAKNGDTDAVRAILQKDPQSVSALDDQGMGAIHRAANRGHKAVVELLLKGGADVNLKESSYQRTALHMAAGSGKLEIVRFLLDNGADITAKEKDNETAVYYATGSGNLEIVKLLAARGANLKDRESRVGGTPLLYAVQKGHVEVAKYLFEQGEDPLWKSSNGGSLLIDAVFSGSRPLVELLISKGVPIDSKSENAFTPLQMAAATGKTEIAQLLIEKGADLNALDNRGATPLILAIENGYKEIALLLLDRGARVADKMKETGRSALHLAAIRGYGEIVAALVGKGADVNARDASGATPLDYAKMYGEKRSAEILLAKGGKPSVKSDLPDTASLMRRPLADNEAVVWYLGHSGWAVKTANHLLVFDYWDRPGPPDDPGLANGWINPAEIKDQKVTVFSTHSHADHYSPVILEWKSTIPNLTVVTGFKPEGKDGYIEIPPREKRTIDGMEVVTIDSNDDTGVGFFVRADNVSIYHGGDHANRKADFSEPFKDEIDFLAASGLKADLFFAPVSGCSVSMPPEAVRKGVLYTIDRLSAKAVFPMHGLNREDSYVTFAKAAKEDGARAQMVTAANSGDAFVYSGNEVACLSGPKGEKGSDAKGARSCPVGR